MRWVMVKAIIPYWFSIASEAVFSIFSVLCLTALFSTSSVVNHLCKVHSPELKCGQSSDCLTTETGTCICRVTFKTEQNDCSGSLNICLEQRRKNKRRLEVGVCVCVGKLERRGKKILTDIRQTGIKHILPETRLWSQMTEVKGIYWRTYYVISLLHHMGRWEMTKIRGKILPFYTHRKGNWREETKQCFCIYDWLH